jgi:hypothetical protein
MCRYKRHKSVGLKELVLFFLTGTTAYNRLGLSTQIANEYVIAVYELRKPFNNGRIKALFVKAYAEITENNISLLQLLDAMKEIRVMLKILQAKDFRI